MHRLVINVGRNSFEVSVGHAVGLLLIANEMLWIQLEVDQTLAIYVLTLVDVITPVLWTP